LALKVTIIYNEPIISDENSPLELDNADCIIKGVEAVQLALLESGYQVDTLALRLPLSCAEKQVADIKSDVVFNLFEGFDGWPESEAYVTALLEKYQMVFTGSFSHTLKIASDKALTKHYLNKLNIPTPAWQLRNSEDKAESNIAFPAIVKPNGEHGSYGLTEFSVVHNAEELEHQVNTVWENLQQAAVVEEFLPGREFRVSILEDEDLIFLPVEEIIYNLPPSKPNLLTYAAKWIKGDEYFSGTKEQCPAAINSFFQHRIEDLAKSAYLSFNCRHYACIDLRQDQYGELKVIDINPNPDISPGGGMKLPLEVKGVSYQEFIKHVVELTVGDDFPTRVMCSLIHPSELLAGSN
jgi:D-alanine-D-alanine ligase